MHGADYAMQDVCPSICQSIRLSHTGILSNRLNIFSHFFHHQVATPFQFYDTKRQGNIPTGTPLMGASNARGMKNRHFRPISRYISETVWDTQFQWSTNRNLHTPYSTMSFRMTLTLAKYAMAQSVERSLCDRWGCVWIKVNIVIASKNVSQFKWKFKRVYLKECWIYASENNFLFVQYSLLATI